ncbi:hypothetical protein [Mammaliicoccus sciuri]|uniref:hypothetical protein n=1 Tax=Mammaliicoccus sciuri TaxID=1296 RepID=UPI000D1F1392|nr:hypothetical protein [Mammaliicoccus sciuri]PTJ71232.1 hypothetical protein BU008_08660 [Mammaliicoccus sciuri]
MKKFKNNLIIHLQKGQLSCIIRSVVRRWQKVNRLERKEKEATIAETKSRTFRNYCLGIASIASLLKYWLGI